MAVNDRIEIVKKKLQNMKKKYEYNKANKEREHRAQLTVDLMDCAGDLGVCKSEYVWIIRDQSAVVREGIKSGFNVEQQKLQLLDAAVGYMLVNETMYVLKSITSYDELSRAFDLLDVATKKITGEKAVKFSMFGSKKPKRSEYGYLNSSDTIEEKKNIVTGFLDDLIETGDIEKCIAESHKQKNMNPNIDNKFDYMSNAGTDASNSENPFHSDGVRPKSQILKDARLGNIKKVNNDDGGIE